MLNKKKIFITIFVLLVILSLSVLSVLAFEFRQPVFSTTTLVNPPSLNNVQDLAATLQLQLEMQMGSTLGRTFYMLCYVPDGDKVFAIVSNADEVTVTGGQTTSSVRFNQPAYRLEWNQSTGFYQVTSSSTWTVYNVFVYYANFDYPATNIPAFHGFNPNASFGTQNYDTQSALTYYQYIYDSVMYREERESSIRQEAQSEGESIGFEEGAEAGYFHGYDIGYADGLDEGEANGIEVGKGIGYETGYESGYSDGFDEGYDTGFSDGYKRGEDIGFESGYDEGYSEGYETGYQSGLDDGGSSEPLQIFTAYIFRFDENNVLQYSWYNQTLGLFAWVDFQDRFDPTKSPFTFIVRLTESDLNNSSTQIELPLDFISSPGNRDYSVSSFDPDFLSGYGNSLSLFVTTSRSYNNGYNVGLQDGADLLDGISDISAKPISALRDALDFQLFGVNIGLVVVALVSVLIVFVAYKFVKKIFPI